MMHQKSLTTHAKYEPTKLGFPSHLSTESSLFIQHSRSILISQSFSSERNLYHAVTGQIKGNLT